MVSKGAQRISAKFDVTISVTFIDNPLIAAKAASYESIVVDTALVLESWRMSLMSHEWLDKNGAIKATKDLKPDYQTQQQGVLSAIKNASAIAKPVLGIGIYENVEIGIGRDVFLTLASLGMAQIPVHIPASMAKEFKPFAVKAKIPA
jgi:hypothetical protein